MLVSEIMSTSIKSVNIDENLENLQKIFELTKVHHLIVTDEKIIVGMISDRDVLKHTSPYANTLAEQSRDHETLDKKAHQIMSRLLITINESADIKVAAEEIINKKISCLPVTNDEQKLVGIMTWRDLLKTLYASDDKNEELSETVSVDKQPKKAAGDNDKKTDASDELAKALEDLEDD